MNQDVTVVLIDDHALMRQGLRILLDGKSNIRIIGEAPDGHEGVKVVLELKPQIVLMDFNMPVLDGYEATRQIKHHAPDTIVIMLSAYDDINIVQRTLHAGASGYVLKRGNVADVFAAISDALRGTVFLSHSVKVAVHEHMRLSLLAGRRSAFPASHLTDRESEVLQLIAEGRSNKQIASLLGISIKTVEKHRQSIMNKLNIHDVAGLTRHVLSHSSELSGRELTFNEIEVLFHLAHGRSTPEIARELDTEPSAVETHRLSIIAKTGASSIQDYHSYAIRKGIIAPASPVT